MRRRVAVCLLVDDLGPDAGTERQVEETVSRIDPARYEVHVCCFADSARLRRLARCAATAVFPFENVYTLGAARQLLRFRRYLRENHIELVHAFMVKSAIFAVAAGVRSRCAVVTSRLNTGYWYTPTYRRFFRLLNRGTRRVFANSEAVKGIAVAAEGLDASIVSVIYNGVDLTRYGTASGDPAMAARIGIPADAPVVGIVSNLRPVKDVALFLRAAAVVARRVPEAAFLIVGQGPLRDELGRLSTELGLEGAVYFSDGRGEVPDYLRRMAVGCLCSRSEGFSNALLEYMAAGLPVVATDVGGNGEAIVDGVTGYLVRERTPEAFAAPVIELLECEEHRAAMGRRALERCREQFGMDVYIRHVEEFYSEVAGSV